MIMRLTELSGSMDTCSRRLYILPSAVAGKWTMYTGTVTGMTSGPGTAGIGGYKYIHDCAGATAGRKEINMAEVFEEGVVIAEVVTDEKDINQEALDHLNEMGKGDEE